VSGVPLLAPLAADRGLQEGHHMATVSGVTTCHVGALQGSVSIQEIQTELEVMQTHVWWGKGQPLSLKILADK